MSAKADTADFKTQLPENKPNPIPPAAERALAEAAQRRLALDSKAEALQKSTEVNGRGGQDPVRYDDWEIKGIASDF
ncbi:COG5508 Uncharacterized conserved small protein [Rhabdaerophilaceae bacterium]